MTTQTEVPDLVFTAERVKLIRVRLGLTQQEFADHMGVGVNSIARWEGNGARPSKAKMLNRLLAAEREAAGV